MRGKHANAAANRRERADLERRAETAERRATRAEKELAELRGSSQHSISTLRAELAQTRKDRDSTAAPALEQAEEKIRTLMAQRDTAQQERERVQERWDHFLRNVVDVLAGMGLTQAEAHETILAAVTPDGSTRTVMLNNNPSMRKATVEQILAIERARGQRGAVDRLASRKPRAIDVEGSAAT